MNATPNASAIDSSDDSTAAMTRYQASPNVLAQAVHDDLVLLDLAGGEYYGLNAVGARAWSLLAAGMPVPTLVDTLLEEFEVGREPLVADVRRLLRELLDRGLLLTAD